jgi:hypothetical protein
VKERVQLVLACAEVIERTLQKKPKKAAHWSTTLMAEETGLNAIAISRI